MSNDNLNNSDKYEPVDMMDQVTNRLSGGCKRCGHDDCFEYHSLTETGNPSAKVRKRFCWWCGTYQDQTIPEPDNEDEEESIDLSSNMNNALTALPKLQKVEARLAAVCPFCGTDNFSILSSHNINGTDVKYCNNCGAWEPV